MSGDLRLSLLLTAQGEQARRELQATGKAARDLGASGSDLTSRWATAATSLSSTSTAAANLQGAVSGANRVVTGQVTTMVQAARGSAEYRNELDNLRAQFNPLFAASRAYEDQLSEIAQAEALGAISAAEAANARQRAAASLVPMTAGMNRLSQATGANVMQTANLAAQFNDIAVMAAYQNPLQLALQQGTQINQVFAQMGGHAQGIRGIGGAFGQMLNPMSLATIGIIAFGTMGVQALLSLREDAKSLEDALADLKSAVEELEVASRMASPRGLEELERQYGRVTAAVLRMVEARERLAQLDSRTRLGELQNTQTEMAGGRWFDVGISEEASGILALRTNLDLSRRDASVLREEILRLGEVNTPSELADQYARLIEMMSTIVDQRGMTEARRDLLAGFIEAEEIARRLAAIEENRGQWDNARADGMLAELAIQQAITAHGEDSRQVTVLRAAAEREAFDETLRTLDITDELRDRLSAAWDAAKGLAATDMASGIARAREEARAMADELGRALDATSDLAAQGVADLQAAQITDPVERAYAAAAARMRRAQGVRREGAEGLDLAALDAEVHAYARNVAEAARVRTEQRELARTRRDGSRATDQQREAVTDLIAGLNDEIALLRETDPVQQELLRHRETLAHATAAERAEIESLIRTRNDENAVLEENQRQMESVRDLGRDVLRGIFDDLRNGASAGDILTNVLDRILDQLLEMTETDLSNLLVGTGSGSGGGGILSLLLGSILGVKMNAMGDVVGSPTLFAYGDNPGQLGVMGEAGPEAIMPLTHAAGSGVGAMLNGREVTLGLTRLSSGKLGVSVPSNLTAAPFAQGGTFGYVPSAPVAPSGSPAAGAGGASVIQLQPVLVNNTSRQVELDVEETTDASGQRQQCYVISDVVSTGLSAPGGEASRTMKHSFGLARPARRRS